MVCDKGAIRHIFSGSNVMAPGLTSEGGIIVEGLEAGTPVAVMAEGKKHAMAVGYLAMSSKDIKDTGKGMAIEIIQFLNDSLWKDQHLFWSNINKKRLKNSVLKKTQ